MENYHLPALSNVRNVELVGLVDVRREQAERLAIQYRVPFVAQEYSDLFGRCDAVLVALPHALHSSVSIEFLRRGIHVLCEKPMATSVHDGEAMLAAAREGRATLAVGLVRRFFDNTRYVKHALEAGRFGRVKSFEIEDSVRFDRLTGSGFYVQSGEPGAGVLWDTGPHVLDLVSWWFGDAARIAYWDDNRGGIEANCHLELEMVSGVHGTIELSRMRRLANRIRLYTDEGMLEIPTLMMQVVTISGGPLAFARKIDLCPNDNHVADEWIRCFARQMQDFVDAIREQCEPVVSGEEALRSLKLIERCQENRQPLPLAEWELWAEVA